MTGNSELLGLFKVGVDILSDQVIQAIKNSQMILKPLHGPFVVTCAKTAQAFVIDGHRLG
ncbi:hypothetical protein D3C77_768580 [compost metagenome]